MLLNSDHIIVGHCSNQEVVQLYNNKIFGVDSSIKKGKYGEVLIIKNKRFFRGTLNGKLIKLNKYQKLDNSNLGVPIRIKTCNFDINLMVSIDNKKTQLFSQL